MQTDSLEMLIELARRERDAALRRMAELERTTERARQSLRLLRGYTDDYQGRGRPSQGQQRDPAADENLRHFLGRLSTAVDTQDQDVQAREHALAIARAGAQEAERRLRSLQTLLDRQAEERRLREERLDQKRTDELAQRSGAARAGALDAADLSPTMR